MNREIRPAKRLALGPRNQSRGYGCSLAPGPAGRVGIKYAVESTLIHDPRRGDGCDLRYVPLHGEHHCGSGRWMSAERDLERANYNRLLSLFQVGRVDNLYLDPNHADKVREENFEGSKESRLYGQSEGGCYCEKS